MTTPLSELEALRWLKDSAAQEPELPAGMQAQLWTRLARDVSTLPLVCTGAATALGELGATNSGAATALGESVTASSGAATALRKSVTAPSCAATSASISQGLSASARTVVARLAIWSAPALVVGAVGGVTWQRAAMPEGVHTGYDDRGAPPAQSASAATVTRDNPMVEASSKESDLPLVNDSGAPLPESRTVSASDDKGAPTSSAEPDAATLSAASRIRNAQASSAEARVGSTLSSGAARDAPASSAEPRNRSTFPSRAEPNAPASSAEPRAGSALARERAVLDRARVALAAGESERALEETKRHAREFPNGILSEEREAIAMNGLVRLGRYTQASQRAARFRVRYPQSLMMQSVDAAMATVPRD